MPPVFTFSIPPVSSFIPGRAQVNLPGTSPYSMVMYLDQVKQAGYYFHPRNADGGTVTPNDDFTKVSALGWPQSMPTSPATGWQLSQMYIHGDIGDQWDLEYPVDCTVSYKNDVATVTETVISPGLKRYTLTASAAALTIGRLWISAIGSPLGPNSIRFSCYKRGGVVIDNKARLAAGEIFDPLFIDYMKSNGKAWGKTRFMDPMSCNANFLKLFSNWTPADFATNYCHYMNSAYWVGAATKGTLNTYTFPRFVGAPTSWTDGLIWSGKLTTAPTSWLATVTKGTVTTIATPVPHGLSNGDLVERCIYDSQETGGSNWNALGANENGTGLQAMYPVTVVDPSTFTIAFNSSAIAGGSVLLGFMPVAFFKDPVLGPKRMVRLTLTPSYPDRDEFTLNMDRAWQYDATFDVVYLQEKSEMSVSDMCELANLIETDPQFTLPFGMPPTQAALFAAAVNTHLDAERTPDFSYSNEVWNAGSITFAQWFHARSLSQKLWSTVDVPSAYGKGLVEMTDAIEAQLGSRPHRFTIDMQHGGVANQQSQFDLWMRAANYSAGDSAKWPGNKVHIATTAPYVLTKIAYDPDAANYTGYQNAINQWKSGVPASVATAMQWAADEYYNGPSEPGTSNNLQIVDAVAGSLWLVNAAKAYAGRDGSGVKYEQYEGGQHQYGGILDQGFPVNGITVADVNGFWRAVLNSQQYADRMTQMREDMFDGGVRYPSQFTVMFPWSDLYGYWGLIDSAFWATPKNPAWLGLKSFNDQSFAPTVQTAVSITTTDGNIIGSVATAVPGVYSCWPEISSRIYSWLRDNVVIATGPSYTFTAADDGHKIKVKEDVSNLLGSATSTSAEIDVGFLFGAGTPGGDVLGTLPTGIGIDVVANHVCIRDAVNPANNYVGTYTSKFPGGTCTIASSLPWKSGLNGGSRMYVEGTQPPDGSQYDVPISVGKAGFNYNDQKAVMANGPWELNVRSLGGWVARYFRGSIAVNAAFKLAIRVKENDSQIAINGVMGTRSIETATYPDMSADLTNYYVGTSSTGGAETWRGTITKAIFAPGTWNDAEMIAKTT